jgi:putative DNA primase/helicase
MEQTSQQQTTNGGASANPGEDLTTRFWELAALSGVEYDRIRVQEADRLGIRVRTLDEEVDKFREDSGLSFRAGRGLELLSPEPWPYPVDGEGLLHDLSDAIRQHVVMSDEAADTAALWVVHTYLLDCFSISPRLAITSPEKQCGKTTFLDVLSRLVARPLPTANVTAAAMFRVVEKHRPTLLIDEADTFLPENEELRGILNSGHRRGGSVIRTVGEDFEPRSFSTYSACAVALIGKLPPTVADRSLTVALRRRRMDEPIEPFRSDRTEHLDQLARKTTRWAADNAERIRSWDPMLPPGVVNRAADNWRPMLAIADAAGGEWPMLARQAVQCAATTTDDESVRVLLLSDVRTIFAQRAADRLPSEDLVNALIVLEGRPWAEWKRGKPMSPNSLARQLAPFGIRPETIRVADRTPKGYLLAHFQDAFTRYLPEERAQSATPQQ